MCQILLTFLVNRGIHEICTKLFKFLFFYFNSKDVIKKWIKNYIRKHIPIFVQAVENLRILKENTAKVVEQKTQ